MLVEISSNNGCLLEGVSGEGEYALFQAFVVLGHQRDHLSIAKDHFFSSETASVFVVGGDLGQVEAKLRADLGLELLLFGLEILSLLLLNNQGGQTGSAAYTVEASLGALRVCLTIIGARSRSNSLEASVFLILGLLLLEHHHELGVCSLEASR